MIPRIGLTVIVLGIESNGALEHPAVITRDWSGRDTQDTPACVNLTIFPDCAMPQLRGSVTLFETRLQAMAFRGGQPGALAAFWPEPDNNPDEAACEAASLAVSRRAA